MDCKKEGGGPVENIFQKLDELKACIWTLAIARENKEEIQMNEGKGRIG